MSVRLVLTVGLVLFFGGLLAACGDDGPPDQPCDLDCGDHGICSISVGRPACLCDAGWSGDTCDTCADGYRPLGTDCVPIGPDPCLPNPCTRPHQKVCQVVEYEAACRCDPDAQDNDGDGACRPTCASLTAPFPAQACDDATGLATIQGRRACQTLLALDPGDQDYSALYARGEFNAWDLSAPMQLGVDGVWSVRLDLSPGDYAYKFFDPDTQTWFEDPANPTFRWVDGERNSRLRVPDCAQPLLILLHQPVVEGDRVSFAVQYLDGATGSGLDAGGIRTNLDGAPISGVLDPASGVFEVVETGLANGKHAFRFEARDGAGRDAPPLVVPVWIEATAFDWRDAVLYFAMTDRFSDGDPGNNLPVAGVDPKANWAGGDFAGLRQQIEAGYFDELGVNAIWLSSISANTPGGYPGDDGRSYAAYHSYWPVSTGWTDATPLGGVAPVDPHFGDLDGFEELVRIAHAHGIRVLVDLVLNHVHEDSPLWLEHQADQPAWFHLPAEGCQATDWTEPITCWFAGYLPDLEYKNPAVMDTLVEHAAWLVRETGIDGFRVDAVKHMIDDVVTHLRARLDRELRYSGQRFYMVGETFTGEDGADLLAHYVGPDRLDGQFDFPLYWQVTEVFLREERDLRALKDLVASNDGRYGDWAVMSTFLGNHDVCRALSQANGDIGDMWCNGGKEQAWVSPPGLPADPAPFAKLRLAWTFLLTSPGVPLIYYGDELGLAGAGDPDNRRPMVFGPDLSDQQAATLAHVGRLTAARAAHPAMRRGQRHSLTLSADGLAWAYGLRFAEDKVVVVLNRSDGQRTVDVPVQALELDEGTRLVDALDGPGGEVSGGLVSLQLDGHTAAVLVEE